MYFRDIEGQLHIVNNEEEEDYLKKEKLIGSNGYVYFYFDGLFRREFEISHDIFEELIEQGLVYKIRD